MPGESATLRGRRILVVEDDYLLAQILSDFLEDAEVNVIGPVGSVDEALAMVETAPESFDGAILDVNLHGSKSYPVADALAARSIPFLFATGYSRNALDERYRDHPRCEKPFDQVTLLSMFGRLFNNDAA
ncbi:response regulator [Bradyrhizobium cosmicum]|uniref:response regulator n=1 Tax=Bradyrhizobium cosmicum TaxID=1404864 RepID=UPI0028E59289|nr:response regulator [Bradyrhizobium cosmicum]